MVQRNHDTSSKAVAGVSPDRLAASLAFDDPVSRVRAVSAARATALGKLGITTVRQLLCHFPHRYIDLSRVATIAAAPIGSACTIVGHVHEAKLKRPKPRLTLVETTLVDETGTCIITCFRQPWLADRLKPGMRIAVSGELAFNYGFKRMTNPFIEIIDDDGKEPHGMVVPVHGATGSLSTAWMRRLTANALEHCCGLEDPMPATLRRRYRLCSRQAALRMIHRPESMDEVHQARRRLVYEEVLMLEIQLMQADALNGQKGQATAHCIDGPHREALRAALPFALTDDQQQAIDQISQQLAAPRRAHHMLLGDVGSGKTVVAAFALSAAADTGTQAAMMAPTEVLAAQYASSLGPLLDAAQISWGLLTASTPPDERARLLQQTADGSLCVLFGTHALLEPQVVFARCSVVVIDEQQRFGVSQREALAAKGAEADILSMTATPIPRSLALTLFGNMTLSYLRGLPGHAAGRSTKVLPRTARGEAYGMACDRLEAGQQVFVVCPLVGRPASAEEDREDGASQEADYAFSSIAIESQDDLVQGDDAKAAIEQARFLQDKTFAAYKVGLLHGRMSGDQKRQVMQDFRDGSIDVLVATTVIEVGIDVPNATVMIIEDADRFGLSQLHQLRGRVGRGSHAGQVYLVSGSKAPMALERLAAMERTEDGFELAEYDLSLRREGDILGNRQHGTSSLKLVNVIRDAAVIQAAHDDAADIMQVDPSLRQPENRALSREMARTFEQAGEGRPS